MYESFYGLRERPFDLTPNPRFLFMTGAHREALSTIEYAITARKGIASLIGPSGMGKTTLVQAALGGQKTQNAKAMYLSNPTLTRDEFFQFIALELGLSESALTSKTFFLRELNALLKERHEQGLATALIIDEAQAMPDAILEEVRLLANTETTTDKLLPVILVGQLELAERLGERALLALKQRIALRATLTPLSVHETSAYIAERLRIAGGDVNRIFKPEAIALLTRYCGGIPRTISVVCDNALVSGFALNDRPIGRSVIIEVCRDLDLTLPKGSRSASELVAPTTAGRLFAKPEPVEPSVLLTLPSRPVAPLRSSLVAREDAVAPMRSAISVREEPAAPKVEPRRSFRSLFLRTTSR